MTRSDVIAAGFGWIAGFTFVLIIGGDPVSGAIGASLGVCCELAFTHLMRRGAR